MGARDQEIDEIYGGRIRIRVCGILVENEEILLVNHSGLTASNNFWSPPGGGLKFGESVIQCLEREFFEESGLRIEPGNFLYLNEFIDSPLHAIEIFFRVKKKSGKLKIGNDPEIGPESQIIRNVEFLSINELVRLPEDQKHNILTGLEKMDDLFTKTRYFSFP